MAESDRLIRVVVRFHPVCLSFGWPRTHSNVAHSQDAKLGTLVSQRAALFEEENRRMNTEEERIALEKTHVERDCAHLEVRW